MIYCLLWPEFAPAQVSVQTPLTTTSFSVPLWLLGLLALSFLGLAALVTKYVYKLKSRLSAIESDLARSSAEWSYAMDFLEDPMYLVDLNDRLIRANRAFYKQIGKTPAQALGQDVRTLIHLKPEKTPCPACAARLERRDAFFTKEADDPTNPTGRPIEVTIRVVKDDSGNPIGIFQGLRDLSHLRETEQALRESQQRLANAQRIARVGNWDWNFTTDELICSTELCNIFGLKPVAAAVSMETLISQLPLNEKTTFRNTLALAIESGKAHALDHRLTLPDTNPRYIHQEIHVNKNNDGRILSISGTAQDVTDTKLAEKALYEEKEKAQITLRSIGDAVLTTNRDGIIEYANPATARLLETSVSEIVGKHHDEVIHVFDSTNRAPQDNPIATCLQNKTPETMDEHSLIISHNGHDHVVDITVAPIRGKNGEFTGCVLVAHDVTEMHNMARKLNYQASHDDLTGLINRREFEVRLSQVIENARIDNQQHALIFMDMDNFKIVNDSCGHLAGDELLKQFCATIKLHLRNTDTFARLGGDEFAILLTGCPLDQAENISADIQKRVSEFRFQWNERNFETGVSMGIALIDQNTSNATEILNNADSACYVAKKAGRNLVRIYKDDDVIVQQHRGQIQWAQLITQALADNRFTLFYQTIQPLVAPDDTHKCWEILVRMVDEQGNLISPQHFIPAAERYQLMTAIDRWVINTAFTTLVEHNANTDKQWSFAINLSGQSLSDPDLLQYIVDSQREIQIDPQSVCFEITETAAITNLSVAKQFIKALKQSGFRFALDDFGSGMSSFAYLRELDIDFLKIDGAFVRQITQSSVDYAMVSSINQIGHLMGIRTIAEFVEDEQILALLRDLEIDFVQGYGIDRPQPLPVSGNGKIKRQAG